MIAWILLAGCMTLDPFFFSPEKVDAYVLGGDVVPVDCVALEPFAAADGTGLYGVWAHQPDAAGACDGWNGAAPPLLYFHGNADNIDHYWDRVERYWEMGYETFVFDYRGYGMSDGTPTHDGVIADGAAAIAHVTGALGNAPGDWAYVGLSLGGFVSIHNVDDAPPRVLVTEDMFASVQKMLDDGTRLDIPAGWLLENPFDNVAAARAMPADVPYLVMHGAEDDYIQPSHAEEVYAAAAADVKRLWLVPGANHADTPTVDPEGYAGWIDCWIAQTCAEE